jgi:3-hydroxybutyryl-CoA dehydrogenase
MEKIGIIGCGIMGHSIALNMAWRGLEIKIHAVNNSEKQRAIAGITSKLKVLLTNKLIKGNEMMAIIERIKFTNSIIEATEGRTFIIEAILEDFGLKEELFLKLGKICEQEVILASTTSGLNISEFALNVRYPERIIITHFWNPAHLMPLVEVVKGKLTNTNCVERALNLLSGINKKPILINKEIPGFIGNRLQFALFREAQYLLELGVANKEDIDAAITYGIGRRLSVTGPFLSADMGGLDVFAAISKYLFPLLSNSDKPFPTLKSLIERHKYGYKTGEGFYNWDQTFSEQMQLKRENELIRWLKNNHE